MGGLRGTFTVLTVPVNPRFVALASSARSELKVMISKRSRSFCEVSFSFRFSRLRNRPPLVARTFETTKFPNISVTTVAIATRMSFLGILGNFGFILDSLGYA